MGKKTETVTPAIDFNAQINMNISPNKPGHLMRLAEGERNKAELSKPGFYWELSNSAVANQWNSVCWGDGLFVAVSNTGTGNRVITSPDGINWTARASAADADWWGVCYGNGLFVAVGFNGAVMTSPDGIVWTLQSSGTTVSFFAVCYSYANGQFVAVSASDEVHTSPDGVTWTAQTVPVSAGWSSVCCNDSLAPNTYVAFAGDKTMHAYNNNAWVYSGVVLSGYSRTSVCWGDNLFVAVGGAGYGLDSKVLTSGNGISWSAQACPNFNDWTSVCWGGGVFVAVGSDGVMTSCDGYLWEMREAAAVSSWSSVCYGDGLFVAVARMGGDGYHRVMTSRAFTENAITGIKAIKELKQDKLTAQPANNLMIAPTTEGGQPGVKAIADLMTSPAAQTANTQLLVAPATKGAAPTLKAISTLHPAVVRTAYTISSTSITVAPDGENTNKTFYVNNVYSGAATATIGAITGTFANGRIIRFIFSRATGSGALSITWNAMYKASQGKTLPVSVSAVGVPLIVEFISEENSYWVM